MMVKLWLLIPSKNNEIPKKEIDYFVIITSHIKHLTCFFFLFQPIDDFYKWNTLRDLQK